MLLSYENQRLDLTGIKAAIFDLDGTLVESEPVWAEAKQFIAKRLNVSVSEELLLSYVGRSVTDFVVEVLKPDDAKAVEQDIIERALSQYDTHLTEITGASALLRNLSSAGLKIAICSSAPERAIRKCMAFLDCEALIDVVVSTEFLARGKPDKMPYVETLGQLGIQKDEAIVFEDAPAGLTAAISAGIKTICVGGAVAQGAFDSVIDAANIGDIHLVTST